MTRALRLTFLTALPLFALDRLTKWFVVEALDLANRLRIEVWDPFLNLRMAWNQGINFGLFNGGGFTRWLLVAIAIAISVALVIWVRKKPGLWLPVSAGAVIGGALGNVYDRLTYGAVADFLNMSCCGIDNPFAFNVADVSIFLGALGLILLGDRK